MGWTVHRSVKICSHALSSIVALDRTGKMRGAKRTQRSGKTPMIVCKSSRVSGARFVSYQPVSESTRYQAREYAPITPLLEEKRRNPKIQQQRQPIVERRDQRPRSHSRIDPQAAKNQRHHSTHHRRQHHRRPHRQPHASPQKRIAGPPASHAPSQNAQNTPSPKATRNSRPTKPHCP